MGAEKIPTDSSGTPLPAHLDGYLLISETELLDPNFYRTVVLIISHNEEGAFGLVVNRRSETTLADVLPDYAQRPGASLIPFVGGPVEQHYLFTLHTASEAIAESEYAQTPLSGVVFEPSFAVVDEFIRSNADEIGTDLETIRLFLGYSGWGPGQLEQELASGAWLVLPADATTVFPSEPDEGWTRALQKKGGLYSVIAQTGFKPSLN